MRTAGGVGVRRALAASVGVLAASWALVGLVGSGAAAAPRPADLANSSWTVYHGNPTGSGADPSGVAFSPATASWTSPTLDGELYGEPLEYAGRVFAATENDTVYALAANTGAVLWSDHVGTPVPSGNLPCGDISPTVGITSTPVIDPGRREIFVVADELHGSAVNHWVVGLDLYTGAMLMNQPVDPPGVAPTAQLQRVALNLDEGSVLVGYGGNDGDCSTYHGWLVSVPETGGPLREFEVDAASGEDQGAIWMGGASPEVDRSGNIWLATGNGSVSQTGHPYDDSDGVLELSPSLALEQFFAPSDWTSDNGGDRDLGSSAPALLANGQVVQMGKSQTAYLLDGAALGGIGGQLASSSGGCPADVDGGPAVVGTTAYLPCRAGVLAVSATGQSLTTGWRTSTGANGPPIVAGGLVWTIGGGKLFGLDPSTGQAVQQLALGSEANHFPTPSVGDGLLLAPAANAVYAWSGSAGLPGPPDPPPPGPGYWEAAAGGSIYAFGSAGQAGSMGGRPLARPVVAMGTTPDTRGYWEVAGDGGVFAFGDAAFYGSIAGTCRCAPVVAFAPTPDGRGYWEVASDGGVFAYGDAAFYGSTGGLRLNAPIVAVAATPDGRGYWAFASDGGVFAFGDAAFDGSMGGRPLVAPIVAAAATPDGRGYWEVASDGGVFAFGDAAFDGSMGGRPLAAPVTAMAATPDGRGYLMVGADGGVFTFGDAPFFGSLGGLGQGPVVAVAQSVAA